MTSQGQSFNPDITSAMTSQGQYFNPDSPPGPPPPAAPPPPPPVSDQAPPGYSSPGLSSAPPRFPTGNFPGAPPPGHPNGAPSIPPSQYDSSINPASGRRHGDPPGYRGSSDRQGTHTISANDQQRFGHSENGGKLYPPYHGRGEEMRNPSLRDLRGSRENLEDMYDTRNSRQTKDARSADSVDFGGPRQYLDARPDRWNSKEFLNGRSGRPPQADFRGSREILHERNGNPLAPADFKDSRGNLNTAGFLAGSGDRLNDKSPSYHASKNSLSFQDVMLSVSVKLDGNQGRDGGLYPRASPMTDTRDDGRPGREKDLYPRASPGYADTARVPESLVKRPPTGASAISFPKASAQKIVRVSNPNLSESSNRSYENFAHKGLPPNQGQGQMTSGGVINLAMDDTISEEPEEVKATRGSRPPGGEINRMTAAGPGMDPRMHSMVMERKTEKGGCCSGRPLFMLWIIISVFLVLTTLFFGLVPLIFFWQAREEWDSGKRAKATISLRWARISLLVAFLALAGGIAYLAVHIHQSQEVIHEAYHDERPWLRAGGRDPRELYRDYYGNLSWDQYISDTYLAENESQHVSAG